MSDEARPIPISSALRDSVIASLDSMAINGAVVAFDAKAIGGGGYNARLAAMYKSDNGWSFAGWLSHDSSRPVKDLEAGFEIRKAFK